MIKNKQNHYSFILLALFMALPFLGQAQEMKRRGSLGIHLSPVSDSLAEARGLDQASGVLVRRVIPNTTAGNLKVEAQDIILSINGMALGSPRDLRPAMKDFRADAPVELIVLRGKKEKKLKGKVVGRPLETSETAEIYYDKVAFQDGWLRTIVNKPKKGGPKYPAVLFIPGYTCSSMDNLSDIHPYKKLIDALVDRGYVVLRVEKPGMGDNVNTPDCFGIDFLTEVSAFEKGFEKLTTYDFVNTDEIFIFGHSLGGLEAPVVATKYQPRGVIVYGTTHEPWMEYLMQMVRFQNPLTGMDYIEAEKDMRNYHTLLYEHYILKKTPLELSENPEFKALLERDFQYDGNEGMLGRSYKYGWSIHDMNMTMVWANTESKVLSLWGEADFEALDDNSHRTIVDIVNHYHPGNATYTFVPRTNHSMIEVGSMEEGVEIRFGGQYRQYLADHFNYKVADIMDEWMKGVMGE